MRVWTGVSTVYRVWGLRPGKMELSLERKFGLEECNYGRHRTAKKYTHTYTETAGTEGAKRYSPAATSCRKALVNNNSPRGKKTNRSKLFERSGTAGHAEGFLHNSSRMLLCSHHDGLGSEQYEERSLPSAPEEPAARLQVEVEAVAVVDTDCSQRPNYVCMYTCATRHCQWDIQQTKWCRSRSPSVDGCCAPASSSSSLHPRMPGLL